MTNWIVGRSFDVDLGPFVPRLTFLSETQMRLEAQIGPTAVDETVNVDVAIVRPNVLVVAWAEASGNFVVQVQDHEAGVVYNHARLADGGLFQTRGTVAPASQRGFAGAAAS